MPAQLNGRNHLTFACSDALNPLMLRAGVQEETAQFICSVTLFAGPAPPCQKHELTLQLDTRDIPYYESWHDVEQRWTSLPDHTAACVPEAAQLLRRYC